MWKKTGTICILIASNFVIHPQMLIFSVFKIASLSAYWLQIKFSMSKLLLYLGLFTFAINLWHRKFVTADSLQCLSTINEILSDDDKILIKSLYVKGYTAKRLTNEFPEKSWTKRDVNKLFKKLRDTGTVDRRPGSGRPCSTHTEGNTKFLLQKFLQSATDFVLRIVRWSEREHLFVRKRKQSQWHTAGTSEAEA